MAAGAAAAPEAPRGAALPVREITLANGMRFLVLPQRGSPTVAFVTQIGVGGVNEDPGTTGIAHLLEHLLFKGTSTIGTREPAAELGWFRKMDVLHDSLLAARVAQATDPAAILAMARDSAEVSGFSFEPPSLSDLFVEAVRA